MLNWYSRILRPEIDRLNKVKKSKRKHHWNLKIISEYSMETKKALKIRSWGTFKAGYRKSESVVTNLDVISGLHKGWN